MGMLPDEPGKITSENEENITVPADGFYRLRLDMSDPANRTYKLVSSKWGIIGDATAGQWDNDTDMQLTNAEKGKYEWSITINLTGGKQIKFRENDNWDIALGITEGNNLSYTGENIPVAADGVYLVKLILDPTGYKYSLEKK
ncbi:SusF/SusE family outer membrane protein [Sphingobacterium tabacisoli]|nr:SusF/SusE family outer membrane protein [Sphingobacterium tabacisoli]